MCRRTTCKNCGAPSWSGCGAHVEQVLADVAVEDRCQCTPDQKNGAGRPGWLQRLFSRSGG